MPFSAAWIATVPVFTVCPYFADCLYTQEQQSIHPTQQITTDAANGTLPGYSLVMPAGGPTGGTSQHNQESMLVGDNYIGNIVNAVESRSTIEIVVAATTVSGEWRLRRLRRANLRGSCPCTPSEYARRPKPEFEVAAAVRRMSAPVKPT